MSDSELSEIERADDASQASDCLSDCEKSPRGENSGNSLNTTLESAGEEMPQKFALKCTGSPARKLSLVRDAEAAQSSDSEEANVSLRSLGLDFV